MKLIKEEKGAFVIKDAEGAKAEELLKKGYELACETDKPTEDAECTWQRITNGYVQVWQSPVRESEDADNR